MNITQSLKLAALALLVTVGFTACSEDEPTPTPDPTPDPVAPARGEGGFFVLCQGNQGQLDGTLDYSSTDDQSNRVVNIFTFVNDKSLGDTPQRPVLYGSKLYIPMFTEKKVWVVDTKTMQVVAEVAKPNANAGDASEGPEAVCGDQGYVYIAYNDGTVTRMDTTAYEQSAPIQVGPNPTDIAAYEGKVYVSISDGYNYANGYQNGFKVVKIDGATYTVEKSITVGMNPGQLAVDNQGNVFVVCRGDYGATPSAVWAITSADEASELGEGSMIAIDNQNRTSRATGSVSPLYVLNVSTDYSNWPSVTNVIKSYVYNSLTREKVSENFLDANNLPINPTGIMDINPSTGEIYICSDSSTGSDAYTTDGKIYIYSANGQFKKSLTTGVHPYGVVFR